MRRFQLYIEICFIYTSCRKEKRADGVSFASLVSNSTENDYEIS